MKLSRVLNLSPITDLSRWGSANAVTSFLPVPSVLALVNLKFRICHAIPESRLANELAKLADPVHGPVLYLLHLQNRELAYASVRRGKPGKSSR